MDIENIKKFMKEKKITYDTLSQLSGIPVNTIKNIFRGKTQNPRIDTMQAIEKALGINNEPVELSPIKKKLIDIISQLSDENVEKAIAILTVINK
jgi:transcriptional regulator with XRE-family HTH domain